MRERDKENVGKRREKKSDRRRRRKGEAKIKQTIKKFKNQNNAKET